MQNEITRPCRWCRERHPVFYTLFCNGRKHLTMKHPGRCAYFLPYEDGLPIPVLNSKRERRREAKKQTRYITNIFLNFSATDTEGMGV